MADLNRNNHVSPLGEFYVGSKHEYFGNRGAIHRDGRVVREWSDKRWLVCVTDDLGPPETFMAPGHHTELFFLDEATALAAGQRPCYRCRPAAFTSFIDLFAGVHPLTSPRAPAMDAILHADRLDETGGRRHFEARVDELPDGVFVVIENEPWLMLGGAAHRWTPTGYDQHMELSSSAALMVLTPRVTVEVIRAGYRPQIDASVEDVPAT